MLRDDEPEAPPLLTSNEISSRQPKIVSAPTAETVNSTRSHRHMKLRSQSVSTQRVGDEIDCMEKNTHDRQNVPKNAMEWKFK